MAQQVDYIGNADARIITAAELLASGFVSPDLVWHKGNNFELLISDDLLAAWLLLRDSQLVIENPPTTAQQIIGKHLGFKPLVFWMHDVPQRIPSGKWVPIAWNNRITTQGPGWDDGIPPESAIPQTTIAAGSNGLNLPQSTISVANNSVLKDATANKAEFVLIRNAGVDTIVRYTGKGAGTLTGTATWGDTTTPMVTGDLVRQANVCFFTPSDGDVLANGGVAAAVFDVAWGSNDVGGRWINMVVPHALGPEFPLSGGGGFCRPVLTPGAPATTPWVRTAGQEQPGGTALNMIKVFQNSGGLLELPVFELAAPRLVIMCGSNLEA